MAETRRSGIKLRQDAVRGTIQHPWRLLSAAAGEDGDAAISLTDDDSLTEVAAASLINLEEYFGDSFDLVVLAMFSSPSGATNPAANNTFGFDLVGYRANGVENDSLTFDPAHLICSAAATGGVVGTQTVNGITNVAISALPPTWSRRRCGY